MRAAIETMFCSATPTLKNRPGWRAPKSIVRFAWARSAVSTTILSSVSARSASSAPATNAGIEVAEMPRPDLGFLSFCAASLPRNRPLKSLVTAASRIERLQARGDFGDDLIVIGAGQAAYVPADGAFHA